jgi:hypothetical protein
MNCRGHRSAALAGILLVLGIAASADPLVVMPAEAHETTVGQDPVSIGPNEAFVGFVNGVSSNAVIRMACFGPVRPHQMGHPFSGQTIEVKLSPALSGPGFTGKADEIVAIPSYPTPIASPVATVLAKFRSYYVSAAISTSVSLPCSGSGDIKFVPVAGGGTARAAVVAVSFVGQP